MEATYLGITLWAQAVEQAGTTLEQHLRRHEQAVFVAN